MSTPTNTPEATEPTVIDAKLFADGAVPTVGSPVRLRASRCVDCQRWEFPALTYCPGCGGTVHGDLLSDSATVSGVTAVLHGPPGALIETPYTVALASFAEGVAILGVVTSAFDAVRIGQPLTTVGLAVGDRVGYGFATAGE